MRRRGRPLLGHAVRFRKPLAFGIALLSVGGAGAAASSLWLSPAGNPLYGFNPGLTQSAPPSAQLDALAVLRRAQTDADRGPGVQAALTNVNNFTTGLRSNYVRVLGATSVGPVVLVPVQTRNAASSQPAIRDALCVYYPLGGVGAPEQHALLEHAAAARRAGGRGRVGAHEYGLVPDGVSSVTVADGSWTKSVAPSGNFFDVALPSGGASGQPSLPTVPTVTFSRG